MSVRLTNYLIDFNRCVIRRIGAAATTTEETKMAKRSNGAVKTLKMKKPVRSGPAVRVEYPKEGETLSHPHYTFHIGAIPEAATVEISIDDGSWLPCRESLGLWWFDYLDAPKGDHVVVARSKISDDLWVSSDPRRFSVL